MFDKHGHSTDDKLNDIKTLWLDMQFIVVVFIGSSFLSLQQNINSSKEDSHFRRYLTHFRELFLC